MSATIIPWLQLFTCVSPRSSPQFTKHFRRALPYPARSRILVAVDKRQPTQSSRVVAAWFRKADAAYHSVCGAWTG